MNAWQGGRIGPNPMSFLITTGFQPALQRDANWRTLGFKALRTHPAKFWIYEAGRFQVIDRQGIWHDDVPYQGA